MKVTLAPKALRDLKDIGDYIAYDNRDRARDFVRELRARCDKISQSPQSGRARDSIIPGFRSIPFKRYVIFYTLSDVVRVERVLHSARDLKQALDDKT